MTNSHLSTSYLLIAAASRGICTLSTVLLGYKMAFMIKLAILLGVFPPLVLIGVTYFFGYIAAILSGAFILLYIVRLVMYARNSILSEETLTEDLVAIEKAYGTKFVEDEINTQYVADNVREYYTHTTDRDYKLLELFVGPGLHSRLEAPFPIGHTGGNTRQPAFVLSEARAVHAKNVLEIGCGRGHCSLFLAGCAPDVEFQGIDLTPCHVAVATESAMKANLQNVHFYLADATKLGTKNLPVEVREPNSVDLIFGVEALCHIDTDEGAAAFMESASKLLRPGGRVMFFDGFRAKRFNNCSENQRKAMKLAECGFRIRAMPSKELWTTLGTKHGMKVVRDVDLTHEVISFWVLGWRVARVALLFPRLVNFFLNSSPKRIETAANLLAVATTAHAMRDKGSAEYGYLVLEKPK